MTSVGDIDIDGPDRLKALSVLDYTPASIIKEGQIEKHNTGVYFHLVPTDPITRLASVDYQKAAEKGWFKIDLLNVYVYEQIKNEERLLKLVNKELDWSILENTEFTKNLIHLGNHSDLVAALRPKNINELSMVLALIRPGKKHLIEQCKKFGFDSISDRIWTPPRDDSYFFKKSHATGYSMLVKVHANLLIEQAAIHLTINESNV